MTTDQYGGYQPPTEAPTEAYTYEATGEQSTTDQAKQQAGNVASTASDQARNVAGEAKSQARNLLHETQGQVRAVSTGGTPDCPGFLVQMYPGGRADHRAVAHHLRLTSYCG